ncbi:unnamed protein product [Heligmosomoides polygyrus]|uniref:Uncharacterized protein n=1 Tax=Heligmosomoides polygyrus TaxID=6339 RepID=A0A183FLY1_HELPZ|nr:unnamed protein product [Heligmosomoides polygyrus]
MKNALLIVLPELREDLGDAGADHEQIGIEEATGAVTAGVNTPLPRRGRARARVPSARECPEVRRSPPRSASRRSFAGDEPPPRSGDGSDDS